MESRLAKFLKLDRIMENVTGYVETRLKLFKIEAREEMSAGIAKLIQTGLVFFLAFHFILFVNIAIALALGSYFDNYVLGFLIVAGLYLILAVLLAIFGERLGLRDKIYYYLGESKSENKNE